MFERREQQLCPGWAALGRRLRGWGQGVALQGILPAGAPPVGWVRALWGPRDPGSSEVEAATASGASVHGLEEEAIAALGRGVRGQVLLV